MPTYEVTSPDGKTWEVTAPDGATQDQVLSYAKQQWSAQIKEPPAAVKAGSALRDVPRQVGLTARYALEGPAQALSVFTEPLRQYVTDPLVRLATGKTGSSPSLGQMATGAADAIGLPAPQTANERVVGDIARTMAGAGGIASASRAAAGATTGVTSRVLGQMGAKPGMQIAGAAGAGGAGGAVREAGGGPVEQFAASILGGLAGGAAAAQVPRVANAARARLTPQTVQMRNADQQIQLVLERAGIDWSQVPERVRQGMRTEVAAALNTGQQLNPDALRRLLVFQRTGTTPTVGMLTQNPGQITREMNLAKTGANSTDTSLQRLPGLQNQNTVTLLRQLDEAGAANAPSAFQAGERAIGSLEGRVNAARQEIGSLYSAARDTQGRSLPLNGAAWTQRANQLLDEAMVGGALPPDVANTMNRVARGEIPLTVEVAEQIKTRLGNLQRGTSDGNARYALGLVRQALDEAPLQQAPQVNPGNLPAIPGTVPPSPITAGQESINAFNLARSANRQFMNRVEANPALRAVVDGVEPDQFVQRYIVGKGASAGDVSALRQELDPQAIESLKQYLVRHLRDAATGNTDDIAKFSNAAYRKALRDIGDEKLGVFFSREELQQLRDIGDAAKYMQAQPAGSAVNNSNSGALMLGRGLDMLESASRYIPLGGRDILQGWLQGAQQTQVLAPRNALVLAADPTARTRMNPLLAAAIAAPVQAREDDRRNRPAQGNRVDARGR